MKDFLKNKILKHPLIVGLILLLFSAIGFLIVYFFFSENISKNEINFNGNNTNIENSLIAQNSPGATLTINEKNIPYEKKWTFSGDPFGTEKWIERYNVLFILPGDKKAFLPKIEGAKEYTIAYTNNDCSDIHITESYRLPNDFDEKNICWEKKLFCNEDDESKELKKLQTTRESLDKESKSNNWNQYYHDLYDQYFKNLYKIISYSAATKATSSPSNECVKLK